MALYDISGEGVHETMGKIVYKLPYNHGNFKRVYKDKQAVTMTKRCKDRIFPALKVMYSGPDPGAENDNIEKIRTKRYANVKQRRLNL